MKYLFVFIVVLLQIAISVYTHYSVNMVMPLMQVFSKKNSDHVFTARGIRSIQDAYSCFNDSALHFYSIKGGQGTFDEAKCLHVINETVKNFPIHLLQTRRESDYIEIDIIYNVAIPFTITYKMIKVNGKYEIDEVRNVCELFKRVNFYFDESNK